MSETPSSYTPPPPPPGGSYTPPPPPPPGAAAPGGDRTIMIVLSYLGILALIPLLMKKDDPDVQWHAKNGLALFGAEVICWIALTILGIILSRVFSALSCGIGLVQCAVWIGFLALSVLCIVKGVGGQRFRIPVVTDMAEKM